MKTRALNAMVLVMLVVLAGSLVACSCQTTKKETPTPTSAPAAPATATATAEPSATPEPTETPQPPTATPQPTSTPRPAATAAPSSTPRPTSTPQPVVTGGGAGTSGGAAPVMTAEMQALVEQLTHGDDAARKAAAQQLAAMGPEAAAAIPTLIQTLQASSGEELAAVGAALQSITGVNFGTDYAAWQQWWQGQQATITADSQTSGSGGPLSFPEPTGLDAYEAVDDGYRVTIIVHISGGTSPFGVQHDVDTFVTTQRDYPLVFTASGCTINHTIAVTDAGGQSVSHAYFIHAPWCD